ncbi:MAG: hypothetical protein A2W80_05365 [Candidatus Riflebacteria bacterium GWC2_50_8]|nr:MAG: hypothetical protein A2W80_05365 [Candidatus Riflebacteria bacterium GWC2_50_8]
MQERVRYLNPFTDIGFKLFIAAEIAKLTPEESRRYEDSLKAYRDIKNSLDTARDEGREEGVAAQKASLTAILQLRFGQVSAKTSFAIESISNLEFLKNLVIKAALAESSESFETYLNSLVKPAPGLKPDNKVAESTVAYIPAHKPRTKKRK